MAAMAATISCGCLIAGNWKSTGRPFRRGASRSRQSRRQRTLPSRASPISVRISASASPSSSCSTSRVVLFRAPGGRPGFPGSNGRPRIFFGAMGSPSLVFETVRGFARLRAVFENSRDGSVRSRPGSCYGAPKIRASFADRTEPAAYFVRPTRERQV
jgi:hypothetical protein